MNFKDSIPERFRAKYDRISDRWIVLDTWNEQIQNVSDFTQNIPDDHPAIKIVAGGELNAILGELKKMGQFNIIKEPKQNDIINKEEYMSNSDIAEILEKIADNLKNRRKKKFQ